MVSCNQPKFMLNQKKSVKACEFQEICPTTNYWIEEQKSFIKEVCKTNKCVDCIQYFDFINQQIKKDSEEWKQIVKNYEKRRKKYPPYGVINCV